MKLSLEAEFLSQRRIKDLREEAGCMLVQGTSFSSPLAQYP